MRVSNCTEFEQRLRESIETRADIDVAAFCARAAACDGCQRLWEEHLLLNRAVTEWNSDRPDVDLADAVLAQHAFNVSAANENPLTPVDAHTVEMPEFAASAALESRPRVLLRSVISGSAQRYSSRQRNSALAVLAAAALVLFFIAIPFNPTAVVNPSTVDDRLADRPPTARHIELTPEIAEVEETGADVEAMVRDAGSAYLELARDAAGVFTDTVVFIPEQTLPTAGPADASDSNSNDTERSVSWGQELDPIRRDVGHAIDFLFETISNDAEPAT